MKVQRVRVPNCDAVTWTVLGDDYLPIAPIEAFLDYLRNLERSPNTVRSYAYHLKLYWEFLAEAAILWTDIGLTELANFMAWLRRSSDARVIAIQEAEAKRAESTVNVILTSVCMFYDFHERTGAVDEIPLYRAQMQPVRRYKSFLHHINRSKPIRTRLIKLKEPKRLPKTLTQAQVTQLLAACQRIRDKFLVYLLYETGMRIGQALGLRLEDVRSWDNRIQIVPRSNNPNGARAKSKDIYEIDTSKELMALYSDYLVEELDDIETEFVFVNLWDGKMGAPMTYSAVIDLFRRLQAKTGIYVTPHMLRHTHATDLIREGWDASYVQKRLGHRQIQTVINTYTHLDAEDLKQAYTDYLKRQGRQLNNETESDSMD